MVSCCVLHYRRHVELFMWRVLVAPYHQQQRVRDVGLRLTWLCRGRVSPIYRMGPQRVTDVPCRPGDLPPIDVVLVSHSHYDHLDLTSIAELEGASRRHREADAVVHGVRDGRETARVFSGTRYVAPIRAMRAVLSTGVVKDASAVLDELDWWQAMDVTLPNHPKSETALKTHRLPASFTLGGLVPVPAALPSGELVPGTATDGDGSVAWTSGRMGHAVELAAETTATGAEMRIVAVPAQHNTQRWFNDRNASLWSGFAVESGGKRFFFSGDTGYQTVPKGEEEAEHHRDDPTVPVPRPVCPAFRQAGAALGPFDACALPIGAYSPRWFMSTVHADTCDAVRMHGELRSRRSVGMHWGTFQLTDEPLLEPAARLEAAAAKVGETGRFTAEPLGRTLELGDARV